MSIESKHILITGGAGFIGTHLYKRLLELGARVTVYDKMSTQIHGEDAIFCEPRVSFIKDDVCNIERLSAALVDVDVVYHLAAETGTGQSMYQIRHYVETNNGGSAAVLEAVASLKRRKIALVLASSRSIYGEGAYKNSIGEIYQPNSRSKKMLEMKIWEPLDDNGNKLVPIATPCSLPPKPGSIYAATKYSQEMLFSSFAAAHGLNCSILRFQNVYGEGQSLQNPYTGILSIFFNRMRQGLPINIFEDGKESRDFVHVSDVVDALVAAIVVPESPRPITVNIGSGEQTSVIQLASLLSELSGHRVPLEVTGDFRVGDIRHCFADLTCAEESLGYSPKIPLQEGLSRFLAWAKDQPTYRDQSARAMTELASKGLTS